MLRVTPWLLNSVYAAGLCFCLPWLLWSAWRYGKYREGLREKLLGQVPPRTSETPCLWIHAVSVGEVNLVATTVDEWRRRHPDWDLVISTTTQAGYQVACQKYRDLTVCYAPLDFSWAVSAAIRRLRPSLLVLAETEIWPNLILRAHQSGVRVAVINGRLGTRSFRGYRRLGRWIRSVLQRIDVVAAQDRYSADHFRRLGVVAERLHVTGSVKYDGALADREHPRVVALRNLLRFPAETIVWIAGSTQAPEERVVIDIFAALRRRFPLLRLLLVPRHPQRFPEVAELLDQGPFHWQRRSSVQRPGDADASAPIWLIDSVGELAAWWGVADLATVGGSFGDRGGQNMIEPAAYGAAVSFGPHTENFRDIVRALLSAEAAFRADDFGELQRFVARCLEDAEHRAAFGRRARCLVAEQQGATQRTADLLDGLLTQEGPKKTRAAA